jgi:hypothetical protein
MLIYVEAREWVKEHLLCHFLFFGVCVKIPVMENNKNIYVVFFGGWGVGGAVDQTQALKHVRKSILPLSYTLSP